MTDQPITESFDLERDRRGSVVHVRDRQTRECIGCVEVGLFEILRLLVLAEHDAQVRRSA
jgi:hypothetical protein